MTNHESILNVRNRTALIIHQAIKDIERLIELYENDPVVCERIKIAHLTNFWAARKYFFPTPEEQQHNAKHNEGFEHCCDLIDLNSEAVLKNLKPRIDKGRKIYGEWVRTVSKINFSSNNLYSIGNKARKEY